MLYFVHDVIFSFSSLEYLDRVRVLKPQNANAARSRGYVSQSGVLRTNCVDCLDRTNGGQFAVAMRFLTVSLVTLGILGPHQMVEPSSQLLLSLMDMFGEMGDRIALQYGGSEAHKKVIHFLSMM